MLSGFELYPRWVPLNAAGADGRVDNLEVLAIERRNGY